MKRGLRGGHIALIKMFVLRGEDEAIVQQYISELVIPLGWGAKANAELVRWLRVKGFYRSVDLLISLTTNEGQDVE